METNQQAHPVTSTTDAGPDLAGYRGIHQTLRAANDQLVAGLQALPPTTARPTTAKALQRWFAGYRGELLGHHEIEDDLLFPALAERVPAFADYAADLGVDHHRTDELLDAITADLDRLVAGTSWVEARMAAIADATELRDLLDRHLDGEDRDILPMFERHFGAEEWDRLDEAALASVPVRQALFTVPWFMATAAPEDAARTYSVAPLPLKVVWRLTRRRYARLEAVAFGPNTAAQRAERSRS